MSSGRESYESTSRKVKNAIRRMNDGVISSTELCDLLKWSRGKVQGVTDKMIERGELHYSYDETDGMKTIKLFSLEPSTLPADNLCEGTHPVLLKIVDAVKKITYFDMKDFLDGIISTAIGMDPSEFNDLLPDDIKEQMNIGDVIVEFAMRKVVEKEDVSIEDLKDMIGDKNG